MDQSWIFLPSLVLLILVRLRTRMDHSLSIRKRTTFTKIQRLTRFEKICYWRIKVLLYDIKDVLPVNCVLLPAQPRLSLSKVSQDQMDQEELPNTILIWPSVFIVDFVKLPVQLMLSLKDQTFKAQPLLMKSFSMIKQSCLKMVTDGNHNSQETSNLKLEVDSLLIDIFLSIFIMKYFLCCS